jgi:DNA-binding CsgD family transcriptional regulator
VSVRASATAGSATVSARTADLHSVENVGSGRPREGAVRALTSWIDEDPRPRILASLAGEVLWTNAAARALRAAGFPFSAPEHLGTDGSEWLDPALAARVGRGLEGLQCLMANHEWIVWAYRLQAAQSPCVGLTLRRRPETPVFDVLAQCHHLTRAEARIVTMMLAGAETADIARELDISVETLRTHVKHAYRKLGVSSRGGLFASAIAFLRP